MRVTQPGANSVQNGEVAGTKQGGRAAGAHEAKRSERSSESEKGSSQGASSEISSKSRDFATAKAAAEATPDVREDRVADLKKRISDGSYKVNAEGVANRLVDDHLKMSGII